MQLLLQYFNAVSPVIDLLVCTLAGQCRVNKDSSSAASCVGSSPFTAFPIIPVLPHNDTVGILRLSTIQIPSDYLSGPFSLPLCTHASTASGAYILHLIPHRETWQVISSLGTGP